jgi:hypothetical protein
MIHSRSNGTISLAWTMNNRVIQLLDSIQDMFLWRSTTDTLAIWIVQSASIRLPQRGILCDSFQQCVTHTQQHFWARAEFPSSVTKTSARMFDLLILWCVHIPSWYWRELSTDRIIYLSFLFPILKAIETTVLSVLPSKIHSLHAVNMFSICCMLSSSFQRVFI